MNIEWTARGTEVPEPLRNRLEQQINKLERFLHGHVEAQVVVTQHGEDVASARRSIEVIVRNRVGTFTAKDESHDLAESARDVMQRIDAQVHRAHDKLLESRRRGDGREVMVTEDEE